MSVIFSQTNNGLVATSTANFQKTNADKIYFTVPWHPSSRVSRVVIYGESGYTGATPTYILKNGAKYRDSSTTRPDQILAVVTSATAVAQASVANFDPAVFVEDDYNQPYLTIMIDPGTYANKVFKIRVYGEKAVPSTYTRSDSNGVAAQKKLGPVRVLKGHWQTGTAGTGGTVFEMSQFAQQRATQYTPNQDQFSFMNQFDFIYVGSKSPITKYDFEVGIAGTSGTGFSVDFYNGSAWSSTGVTWYDNTSDGHKDNSALVYNGVIEAYGSFTNTWKPAVLDGNLLGGRTLDPLIAQKQGIDAGITTSNNYNFQVYPSYLGDVGPRYWLRFRMFTHNSVIRLTKISPVA
jgi:hypothetical protein